MSSFFGLEGKKVLITGANGGVGTACAKLFALQAKAEVILLARSDCTSVVNEIASSGGKAKYYSVELTDKTKLICVFNEVKNDHNEIDVLLNIAGACEFYNPEDSPLDKMFVDEERWKRILDINGKAVFDVIELSSKLMPKGSSIVNISSTAGAYGAEMAVAEYSFAKAGVIGLTLSYAKILGSLGIRVNAIAPGPIEGTAMLNQVKDISIPEMKAKNRLNTICTPDDVAKIALFLASNMSRVLTGVTINANAGQFFSF